jgi:8-oxo-dGTP pyrophosphatase MutT (NUDIX family)
MTRPLVLAAGGVLWRDDPGEPEVAVVHRPAYDDWSLPKGKAKPGEHLLVTALREVAE